MSNLKKILRQFIKFLFLSGIGWLIDFTLYLIFSNIFDFKIIYSNILSSIPAVTFVFFVSTRRVFVKNKKGFTLKEKYFIYFLYQVILIITISLLGQYLYLLILKNIAVKIELKILKLIIKILITPITMLINFIVMKFLIEKL
ncbi:MULTISPECIES: GtrA family protein [Fusobacterium]|uniref:GtrA family protein n=1 Tax=Fusobacterium TaxID=848 RepID=UPI002A82069C|nr:GtrA family protein [Fusobacterium sp.]